MRRVDPFISFRTPAHGAPPALEAVRDCSCHVARVDAAGGKTPIGGLPSTVRRAVAAMARLVIMVYFHVATPSSKGTSKHARRGGFGPRRADVLSLSACRRE